ncbi:MAG: D-alanine--D-alanine ligase [Flavobacterium sp.]|nr:D-alanine--D-alanine ligase [Flavobacterium sp.]
MNIAVVMGGYSDESVISLRSGQLILESLDRSKYTVFEVHVLTDGWFAIHDNQRISIDKADFSFTANRKVTFDVIVNTIHGTPGEDGHLQAYWELVEIPYTGCNFYQSALTFNKRDTLSVLSKFDIPKARSVYLSKGDDISGTALEDTLGLPFFVKPNQSGSSLGVTKVNSLDQLDAALEFAFAEDSDILIESFLDGVEISVGVLKLNGKTTVLGLTEIVSHNEFFDYAAKYSGESEEITPARISDEIAEKVITSAKKVYDALGMTGFSRSEFIIMDDVPHFIEINTNPGLSPQSIFPQQARFANIEFSVLLDNEIELALQRKPLWRK